jgi:hypothetical protein
VMCSLVINPEMEAIISFTTLITINKVIWGHNPEALNWHSLPLKPQISDKKVCFVPKHMIWGIDHITYENNLYTSLGQLNQVWMRSMYSCDGSKIHETLV